MASLNRVPGIEQILICGHLIIPHDIWSFVVFLRVKFAFLKASAVIVQYMASLPGVHTDTCLTAT